MPLFVVVDVKPCAWRCCRSPCDNKYTCVVRVRGKEDRSHLAAFLAAHKVTVPNLWKRLSTAGERHRALPGARIPQTHRLAFATTVYTRLKSVVSLATCVPVLLGEPRHMVAVRVCRYWPCQRRRGETLWYRRGRSGVASGTRVESNFNFATRHVARLCGARQCTAAPGGDRNIDNLG
jgi:hypothetical protein